MRKRIGALLLAVGLLSGCTSGDQEAAPTGGPAVGAVQAVIDADTASVILPLDRYAMTAQERRTALAAQQIVVARCVTGSSTPGSVTIDAAKETLEGRHFSPQWLYGYWDAAFISSQGWQITGFEEVPLGQGLDITKDQGRACVQEKAYLDLMPVGVDLISYDTASDDLRLAYLDAMDKTVSDQRFIDLVSTRSACVEQQGFTVESAGNFDGVALLDTYTEEQKLQAILAEAQCSDQENLVQQAGGITAAYQQEYIDSHQGELTALRQLIDERVARATGILQDAGVM